MQSLARIFKAYDIRGVYPEPLDERAAWCIGVGAAQHLLAEARRATGGDASREVVVGRDMRRSSPALASALKTGLRAGGAHVVDIGMVDTPLVGFAARQLAAAGGVQVTASHNPAHYNGFKVCGLDARPVGSETGLQSIQALASAADCEAGAEAHAGADTHARAATYAGAGGDVRANERAHDPWPAYREHLLRFVPASVLDGSRRLRVAVDASNGMAGSMVPKVFAGVLGLEVVPINFDNALGEFVHEPNPLVEANLRWTQDGVREHRADFGVCFDGDADRCMVVDERGAVVGCDLLTAWLAQGWLRRVPGASIVFDLRSTHAVRETIVAAGGTPIECRVGHVFMKQRLRETQSPFGGELSGHFYYRDMGFTDNGARAFIDVVCGLVDAGQPLSACIAPFRRYAQSGELNFENADTAGALAALRARYPEAAAGTLDGLTLDNGDWWCNVSASNTEPLLRLNLEARDQAEVRARVAEIAPLLGRLHHG